MMLADGDFVHVREYRPPPEHVVSRKKSTHEARLEAAQHLFRCVPVSHTHAACAWMV